MPKQFLYIWYLQTFGYGNPVGWTVDMTLLRYIYICIIKPRAFSYVEIESGIHQKTVVDDGRG